MQRLVLIASAAALGALLPVVAEAQTSPAQTGAAPTARQLGLRYLEWPGKAARPAVAAPAPASAPRAAPPPASTPPPTAHVAAAASPNPQPQPQPQPQPMASAAAPATQPVYGRVAPSPYQPQSGGLTAAAMMPVGPADPMAPRRDAPIFSMASSAAPAPTPAPTAAPAPAPRTQPTPGDVAARPAAPAPVARASDDPRYYSVHRMAGRDPDPIPLPAPFFLDAAPVDLAEPPPPPTIVRNGAGAVAATPEPDLP